MEDLDRTAFHLDEEKKIGKFDDKIESLQHIDTIDKEHESLHDDVSLYNESEKGPGLVDAWHTLFSDSGNGETTPVDGKRFALVLDEIIDDK